MDTATVASSCNGCDRRYAAMLSLLFSHIRSNSRLTGTLLGKAALSLRALALRLDL